MYEHKDSQVQAVDCFCFYRQSSLIAFLYALLASEEILGENKVRDFLESVRLLLLLVSLL
jgi:hypothetical protein